MHAVAAGWHGDAVRTDWMSARARSQSRASRSTRGVDARPGDGQNGPVTPRSAPGRHQAVSTEAGHSD
jgi:RNA polymerase sigma-70 factor (ECF subfamily)